MTDFNDPYLNMPAPENSEGVSLPFSAVYLSWENGQPATRQLGGLPCFGGWSAKQKQADEIEGLQLPRSFGKYDRAFKGGNTEPCYGARLVTVSIFASRQRFHNRNDERDASMTWRPGDTRHIQWLAAMFLDASLSTFVPVVLTTKGTQTKRIDSAMKEWRDVIVATDAKLGRYPISAFAITIGSQGEQPVYEKVGDGAKTYIITPIKAAIPEDPTKRLIPPAVVQRLTELRQQANDWLVNWNKRYGQEQLQLANGAAQPAAVAEDIPF